MFSLDVIFLAAGTLLLVSVLAGRLSDWLGVPSLLLFLGIGMLAGSEGLGRIEFTSPALAQSVGSSCLVLILFSGGLDTNWKSVRPALVQGLLLSTVGVLATTGLLATFIWWALGSYKSFHFGTQGLSFLEALLLASIVSSTDAAAVFSLFRTSPLRPKRSLSSLLELESGSNDPMALLLTTTLLAIMTGSSDGGIGRGGLSLVVQLGLGVILGVAGGAAGAWLIGRIHLSVPGLYRLLALSVGLLTYGAVQTCGGNGILAVYVAAVVLGNCVKKEREGILTFHDGISWLAQIAMFIVLGLLVFPSQLVDVMPVAVLIAFFLMFVARPIAVALCLLPFRPPPKELAYVSWVGLRGSVPIVLATFPAAAGLPGAEAIFNVVFFVVLTSVLVQGLSLVPVTRWLKVHE